MELGTDAQRLLWRVRTGSGLGVVLLKFILSALLFMMAWSLTPLVSHAGESLSNRFDGMSAIEIEVAAALAKSEPSETNALESVSGVPSGPDFSRCDLVETKGRAGHEGDFPIPGNPLPGQVNARVTFTNYVQDMQFRLETPAGALLEYIDLDPPSGQNISTYFLGSFELPSESFRVAAAGKDMDNQAFDRACEQIYTPQSVEVRFQKEIIDTKPGLLEMVATVTNHGPLQTFQFDVSDALGLDVEVSPSSVELAEGASIPLTVSVDIPAISSGVLETLVIATATSQDNPEVQNHAKAVIRTEHFEQVFLDSYE